MPLEGHQFFGQVLNFSEYFGPAVACDAVPESSIEFTQPAGNSRGDDVGTYDYYSNFSNFDKLDCTGGSGTPKDYGWTQGVQLMLGGPQNVDQNVAP